MHPLSAQELLEAWESGRGGPPAERALALLAAACPETPVEELARENVGRRDARLLTLREWTFGPHLVSLAACPACGERVESAFAVADVRLSAADAAPAEPLSLTAAGHELTFRLPTGLDVAALAGCGDVGEARRLLLARCLLAAYGPDGEEVFPDALPEATVQAIGDRMAAADPQADVQLALRCPSCGHTWSAAFDVAAYFWIEVDAWARVLLREIHVLASAYGWREADILALSPWRRRCYLELIGA